MSSIFSIKVLPHGAPSPPQRRPNVTRIPAAMAMHDPSATFDAAKHTSFLQVDTYVKSGMTIGLGTGQASSMAIQYLGHKLRSGTVSNIKGVAMSITSASEAAVVGIPLEQYQNNVEIDLAFDDADALEETTLQAIIGRRKLIGGESIVDEKRILNAAKDVVLVANEAQVRNLLEGSVPVVIESEEWMGVAEQIDDLFLGDAEVWRRPAVGHAGPTGGDFPFVTNDGRYILDVVFTSPIFSLADVARSLLLIEGVVDHGIISKMKCHAVVTGQKGLRYIHNTQTNAF